MILIVTYDLHNPGRDYAAVKEVLESADYWYHAQGSVWFLDTLISPAVWRDKLKAAGDSNDSHFVDRMTQNWASFNMANQGAWLNDLSRRW
jgi:hypothetical protein